MVEHLVEYEISRDGKSTTFSDKHYLEYMCSISSGKDKKKLNPYIIADATEIVARHNSDSFESELLNFKYQEGGLSFTNLDFCKITSYEYSKSKNCEDADMDLADVMKEITGTNSKNWQDDINTIKTAVLKQYGYKIESNNENFKVTAIIITTLTAIFFIVNNFKTISLSVTPTISWLYNTAAPISISFLGTPPGLAILALAIISITTLIILRNNWHETQNSADIAPPNLDVNLEAREETQLTIRDAKQEQDNNYDNQITITPTKSNSISKIEAQYDNMFQHAIAIMFTTVFAFFVSESLIKSISPTRQTRPRKFKNEKKTYTPINIESPNKSDTDAPTP